MSIVFKGTLMLLAPPDLEQSASLRADLAQFLALMVPTWPNSAAWIDRSLEQIGARPNHETRFRDLGITIKLTGDCKRIVLGVTWQPPKLLT